MKLKIKFLDLLHYRLWLDQGKISLTLEKIGFPHHSNPVYGTLILFENCKKKLKL